MEEPVKMTESVAPQFSPQFAWIALSHRNGLAEARKIRLPSRLFAQFEQVMESWAIRMDIFGNSNFESTVRKTAVQSIVCSN